MAYRYDDANVSNKLLAVTDNNTSTSSTVGFSDGNTSGDDYDYWPDGSLKKDLNRGITDIQYNLLKLPRQLTFSSGKVVSYQYDAGGSKLKMSVTGAGSETRDYIGPFQYLNNALFEIGHEEGRYSPTGGYEYFHKDHLGNVRVAFNASGITQYTDYDPWGLPLWGGLSGGNSTNRDRYNGKESLSELGAGVSDYGARLQDATIGRWFVVDPLAEISRRFSPYAYVYNNPLRFIDPDGMNGIEPRPDFNYSDGYSSGSADNSSSVGRSSFSGTFGGDEPIKGGGFPKGDLPSTVNQNAILRSAESGPRYTEVEKASQLGVNLAWTVEGGYGLLKLGVKIKSLLATVRNLSKLGEASSESTQLAGSIRGVNKVGGTENCVNCAISVDAILSGKPASALSSAPTNLRVLELLYGRNFAHNLSVQRIENIVGIGQRGIVFGNRGSGEVGHVFNVVNQKGVIRFLDGQTGKAANLNDGFKNFSLLITN